MIASNKAATTTVDLVSGEAVAITRQTRRRVRSPTPTVLLLRLNRVGRRLLRAAGGLGVVVYVEIERAGHGALSRHLLVLGGIDEYGARRLDHQLATILALGHSSLAGLGSVRAVLGTSELLVLHPGRRVVLDVEPGQTFSLLALHGPCAGVQVSGARWPLVDASLTGTEARGVSNEATERTEVHVATGVLTVVVP